MLKILIAEDDFVSRRLMLKFLSEFGDCDVTVDGLEAVEAFTMAIEGDTPYDLICLDIMMPALDGYRALQQMRQIEEEHGIPKEKAARVIITTALNEGANVNRAFDLGCVAYASKPIDKEKFEASLRDLKLI